MGVHTAAANGATRVVSPSRAARVVNSGFARACRSRRLLALVIVCVAVAGWLALASSHAEVRGLRASLLSASAGAADNDAGLASRRGVEAATLVPPGAAAAVGAQGMSAAALLALATQLRQQQQQQFALPAPPPSPPCPTVDTERAKREVEEAVAAANAASRVPRWRLLIFGNQRVASLERLCASLQRAHINQPVAVNFYLEAGQPDEMYEFVRDGFEWPHGPVEVFARHTKGGLINAIIEGWFPANDVEWGVFLEDDIEVSPAFLTYLEAARPLCEAEQGCIGVSLYSPMINELVMPKAVITDTLLRAGAAPTYMAQLPCSWGAAYRPGPWLTFRRWAQHQQREGKYGGDLELARGSGWAASWKRYLLELMLVMDWTLMYPFFGDHAAYSTNHLEVGEHISANDTAHKREHYTHPLRSELMPLSAPKAHFDHLYRPVASQIEGLTIAKTKGMPNRRPTGCWAYSLEGHKTLLGRPNDVGVTVVLTFFYTPMRFRAFLANIKAYCTYGIVRRIIIMWHNREYFPQTMAWCSAGSTTSVHFLMPRVKDTLSNRFIPTYRIRTEAVVTVDDDILVSERDLARMATVLRNQNYSVVVGPFPRWYKERPGKTPRLKYLFNPEAGLSQGYPVMLTKIHVSHFSLYYHYFCDEQYEDMRQLVARTRNAEDLLYIRVAADRHVPPSLFVVTADPVFDTGAVGLHSKKGNTHQSDRSYALEFFGYNDSFWSGQVVLPPGTTVTDYAHEMWDQQHALVHEGK